MSFRQYVLLMFLSTLLAWAAWAFVIVNVQPGVSGLTGLGLFYTTLVVSLIGSFTLIGLGMRLIFSRGKGRGLEFRDVRVSFRHAVLFSLVSVTALVLSSSGLLVWWSCFVLVLAAIAVESIVLVLNSGRR